MNQVPVLAPDQRVPEGSSDDVFLPAEDPFSDSLVSIEGTAVQFDILPVNLPRQSCTSEAERLLRELGRAPQNAAPWLPITTLGPLLVFGHHGPRCDDFWGVPEFLIVKVVISQVQYEEIRRDLIMRISSRPIEMSNAFETTARPEIEQNDLNGAFHWLTENFPPWANQEPLKRSYDELLKKNPDPDVADYNTLQSHLGVALTVIAAPGTHAFNPEEAGPQDMFPASLLEKHCVYPLYCGKQQVFLLAADPDIYMFEDEWLSSGNDPIHMVTVLADEAGIRKVINRYSASSDINIEVDESSYEVSDDANLVEIIPEDILLVDPRNPSNEPEEIVKWVLYTAINSRASDLHLEKYYNTVRFRARIDGHLKLVFSGSEESLMRYIAIIKNYSNLGQSRQEAQDGRFGMAIGRRRIDVRVAAVPCRGEFQKVIMRFLDKDGGMKSLGDLNLSDRQARILDRGMCRDQGLVLVTGPTGSGKTTTLYALLNSVNEEHINLHTIEDPIEYRIEGINQTQTDKVHGISFSTGIRALLRSDPDVILIGECRDEETAMAAVTAAMTGHLVLITLHANDSIRAISRILSMGVPNYLLADSLVLSQAQRLVRKLCNYCKRGEPMSQEMLEEFMKHKILSDRADTPVYGKVGCQECNQTGYNGRLALMEIAEISPEIKDMISEDAPLAKIRKMANQKGLLTLYQEGLIQVLGGETTMDEIKGLHY